jgi:sigma-E factor negative regulatory protein RseA
MKEKISTLMDGELDGKAAAELIDELERDMGSRQREPGSRQRDGEALEAWRTYHLVSDAMRDTRLLSAGFRDRVLQRLAAEPTVLAPRGPGFEPQYEPRKRLAAPAAVAASLAAVGLVGWLALAPQHQVAPLQTPVAQVVQPTPEAKKPAIVPLPTATPDYLLAHQGFSPRISLQGMSAYARTVSAQANEGRK